MKSLKRNICVLMAAVMIVCLAACNTPVSLTKQWGYKTDNAEYPIGTYIYSLYQAYSYAYNTLYNQQGESFDTEASILDTESTFDETGETMLCKDWVLKEADVIMKDLIAVDVLMDKYGLELTEDELATAYDKAYSDWNLGPEYDSMYNSGMGSSYSSYKEVLEPFGISFESFYISTSLLEAKWDAVFEYLYGPDGEKAVSEKELREFFEENYISYSYFTAKLYETTQDPTTGNSVNKAYDDKKIKEIKEELELYSKMMEQGVSFNDVSGAYIAYAGLSESTAVTKTEHKEATSLGDEVLEAMLKLKEGTTDYVVVGEGENAVAFFMYRKNISLETDSYLANTDNYESLLWGYKGDDYIDLTKSATDEVECKVNTKWVSKYSPEMFEDR